jgi:glycosyltransferase involved in cell wall biosynthesis
MMNVSGQKVMESNLAPGRRVYVDHTHLGRHVTGIERITQELFCDEALAPVALAPVRSRGLTSMIFAQNITLPLKALRDRGALILCPGFPPSFLLSRFGERVLPYIHDLFLLTRDQDLNRKARLYMVKPFRHAVKTLPRFLVNSEYTRDSLRAFCRPDAKIMLYRPAVRNVFSLAPRAQRTRKADELRLVALGTVEPRKNLLAAAAITGALRQKGFVRARLDILGRFGWGSELEALRALPGVHLHGYQPGEVIRQRVEGADLFINTSHDEGLGLPLLEAQFAGLPVVAPDRAVFREVLGDSGVLIDPDDPGASAEKIKGLVQSGGWRAKSAAAAANNLARWNMAAAADRAAFIAFLLSHEHGGAA